MNLIVNDMALVSAQKGDYLRAIALFNRIIMASSSAENKVTKYSGEWSKEVERGKKNCVFIFEEKKRETKKRETERERGRDRGGGKRGREGE